MTPTSLIAYETSRRLILDRTMVLPQHGRVGPKEFAAAATGRGNLQ